MRFPLLYFDFGLVNLAKILSPACKIISEAFGHKKKTRARSEPAGGESPVAEPPLSHSHLNLWLKVRAAVSCCDGRNF
jgi:hypothetical protein